MPDDLSDARLEREILDELAHCERARAEGRRDDMRRHWEKTVALIAKRTPKQVRKMERDRGLT